jgi:hypothetical protein
MTSIVGDHRKAPAHAPLRLSRALITGGRAQAKITGATVITVIC